MVLIHQKSIEKYSVYLNISKRGTSFEVPLCYSLLENCMESINYMSKNIF